MTYDVLATDYDGTLAIDGRVDEPTLAALQAAREAGVRLVMVTGRELPDLFNTFAQTSLFTLVVAENGAVLYDPATRSIELLSQPPPPALIERLSRAAIPLSVGHSIVATVVPHEREVLAAIGELALEWHVIFNKGDVMALPADVTKATGLEKALAVIKAEARRTIGIGDAENDQPFLRICGLSVAVANALPAVKASADLVTDGAYGEGVAQLIGRLISGSLDGIVRHRD